MNSDMLQTFALIIQFAVVIPRTLRRPSRWLDFSLIATERLHYHVGMYGGFYLISSFERPSQQLEKVSARKFSWKISAHKRIRCLNHIRANVVYEGIEGIRKIWKRTSSVKSTGDFKRKHLIWSWKGKHTYDHVQENSWSGLLAINM